MLDILKIFNEKNLLVSFPNLYTTIKMYLTIPNANYSDKRAFSKLFRIENQYSSTRENLTNLMILDSENDKLNTMDANKIKHEFT